MLHGGGGLAGQKDRRDVTNVFFVFCLKASLTKFLLLKNTYFIVVIKRVTYYWFRFYVYLSYNSPEPKENIHFFVNNI